MSQNWRRAVTSPWPSVKGRIGRMRRKFAFSLMAIIALSLVFRGQSGKITLTGYIIDKACSARLAKKSDPQAAAAEEPTSCALMEGCVKSGFGILSVTDILPPVTLPVTWTLAPLSLLVF